MSSKNNFCRYGMLIKRGNGTFSSYSHLSRLNIHLYTRFFLWLRLITRGYHVKLHRSRTLLHAQNTVFAIHAGHFAQSTKIGAGSKQRLLVRCMWINGLMCHERARLREITLFYFLQNIEFQCRVPPLNRFWSTAGKFMLSMMSRGLFIGIWRRNRNCHTWCTTCIMVYPRLTIINSGEIVWSQILQLRAMFEGISGLGTWMAFWFGTWP